MGFFLFDLFELAADVDLVQGNDLRFEEEFEEYVESCLVVSTAVVLRCGYIPAKMAMFRYEVRNPDAVKLFLVKTSNPEVKTIITTMNKLAHAV